MTRKNTPSQEAPALDGKAKKAFEESQRKLLKAYLSQISILYARLGGTERSSLFRNLEAIIQNPARPIFEEDEEFDPRIAIEIRAKAGLTQFQLDDELGIGRGAVGLYERANSKYRKARLPAPYDSHGEQNKTALKYLGWLKEHGYNPYKI